MKYKFVEENSNKVKGFEIENNKDIVDIINKK